jgi:hypothetical protein
MAAVFGFPIDNLSAKAERHRKNRLCPFNNRIPNCTKDKANDPLGVCSIFEGDQIAVTCPIRFREDWKITDDAAEFFFPASANWTSLTEVRLKDAQGKSAGNIDIVLVAYDDRGKVIDFGSIEVQAVYISGNIRSPFAAYMKNSKLGKNLDWSGQKNYPHADFLSSSRKRLAPQLIYKGGILHGWKKKQAVVIDRHFFNTLPEFKRVAPKQAEMAWLIYDLVKSRSNVYELVKQETIYSKFSHTMETLTKTQAGRVADFIKHLQGKLDEQL